MKNSAVSINKVLTLIGLVSAVVLVSAAVWTALDSSFFLALFFNDAKELAEKGIITSDFMPVGYSGFLGSCLKIGGTNSVPPCQAFIYIGTIFSAFWFLKLRGVKNILLALGILAISFHPMLVLNVWRVHDGNLTAFLLLGFLAAGILFSRFQNARNALIFGVFAGLLFTVRINAAFLILPALFLFLRKNDDKIRINYPVIFLMSAAAIFASVNAATKHTPFFVPNHGFYNFFSGSNEYTEKYLLSDYSGENSLKEALEARGFSSTQTFEERLIFPPRIYKQLAIDYIKNHPLEYVKLTGLKVFTFFRPGYHMAQDFVWNSKEGLKRLLKTVLAIPFFIWIFLVYKTRGGFSDKENVFVILAVIFYIAPFFIANADPRYRFPIDIVFIADSFCRAKNLFINEQSKS